jgi:hypothetical protein
MIDIWLDIDGNILEAEGSHNKYAYEILEEEMGLEELNNYMDKNNISYPYQILHKRGWIRIKFNTSYLPRIEILGDCIDLTKPMKNTIDPAMNERQMRVAKELCEKYNTSFHIAINDKRFW